MTTPEEPPGPSRFSWRRQRIGQWMLASVFVALTLAAFTDPSNPVVLTMTFASWCLFLTRLVIEILARLFRLPPVEPDAVRRERRAAVVDAIRAGKIALSEGDVETAVEWFETADALRPARLPIMLALADALAQSGRLEEGARKLDEARTVHAGEPSLHFASARVACLSDDYTRAREELEAAGSIDPAMWAKALEEPAFLFLRPWVARHARGPTPGFAGEPGPPD